MIKKKVGIIVTLTIVLTIAISFGIANICSNFKKEAVGYIGTEKVAVYPYEDTIFLFGEEHKSKCSNVKEYSFEEDEKVLNVLTNDEKFIKIRALK